MLLPDIAMVHGRLVVSAWEFGLDGVHDDAVRLLMQAVEVRVFHRTIIFYIFGFTLSVWPTQIRVV